MTPIQILNEVFGYASFRGEQQAIVEHVVAGGDALVLMPTGGGKSLCYQIPAMLRPGAGIVVSPLIASGGCAHPAWRESGLSQFQHQRRCCARGARPPAARRARPALCRPGAPADARFFDVARTGA